MNDREIGLAIRALRRRRGMRQLDLATASGASQALVSLIERGHLEATTGRALRRVAAALDARLVVELRWRGGELDRLIDSDHAALTAAFAERLRARAWCVSPEVTYSSYGERGSIDLFAFHESTGSLLVVEIKTELVSAEQTLRKLDEKARLAHAVGRDRFGWAARSVSKLLVVSNLSTARRRAASQASLFSLALPTPPGVARAWLRAPDGAIGALLFVSLNTARSGRYDRGGRHRIRGRSAALKGMEPSVE